MRDKYWSMYQVLKYKEIYFHYLNDRLHRINIAIKLLALFASTAGIAAWNIWAKYPLVWTAIVGAAQVIQTFSPLFQISKRLTALNFFLPRLSDLLDLIDRDWSFTHEMSDSRLKDLIYSYETRYSSMWKDFCGGVYFPISRVCKKKADIETEKFFFTRYNVTEWSVYNEQQAPCTPQTEHKTDTSPSA